MKTLVVDASIAVKWVVEEHGTPEALILRQKVRLIAPELLVAECANILWKKVKRDELLKEEALLAARLLQGAEIELFRHGLSAMKHLGFMLPRDIDLMARAICGEDIDPLLVEQALVVAESELVLQRVRAERIAAIKRLRDIAAVTLAREKWSDRVARAEARVQEMEVAGTEFEQLEARVDAMSYEEQGRLIDELEREEEKFASMPAPIENPDEEERDEVDAMREAIPDLERLARYEQRAWSRRRRALRNFMRIKFGTFEG